jgi:biopolymer transport protein ExbD
MRIKQPTLRRARIEIIPMIDTIFFLLVFFMITWLTMVKINGMGLTLPKPSRKSDAAPVSIVLALSPAGRYFVDSKSVAADEWSDGLRRKLLAHPNAVVVLNVAPAQKTQVLISIMDTVNRVIYNTHSHAQVLVVTQRVAASPAPSSRGELITSPNPSSRGEFDGGTRHTRISETGSGKETTNVSR